MQVNIALLTVTDTRTIENDKSGSILVKKIKEQNHNLIDRKIVKDEKNQIKKILLEWIKRDNIDVIITTGGTGLTGRDITPEAIREIKDKEIPGFGELFRELSYKTIGTSAMRSISKWKIHICTTWFIRRCYRCLGWYFKISTRYQSQTLQFCRIVS